MILASYDRYIYTGYRALHDAILEANAQGYEFVTDKGYQYNNFIGSFILCKYTSKNPIKPNKNDISCNINNNFCQNRKKSLTLQLLIQLLYIQQIIWQ